MKQGIGWWLVLAGLLAGAGCGGGDDSTSADGDADVPGDAEGDAEGAGDADGADADGDDGFVDAADADGGEPCTTALECDDDLFCNGEETCSGGFCGFGDPPELDDGVSCTVDSCDEDADEVAHAPDDAACSHLDADPTCDADDRLVGVTGVCDPGDGCVASSEIDDCTDPPPARHCTGSASTGDLAFLADGFCDDSGEAPACSQVSTPCTASADSCAGGMLTTAVAVCDPGTGCGDVPTTSPCPTTPNHCEGTTFVTYLPQCADAAACGAAVETRTPCPTPATTCEGEVHTVWAARCDPATGCGAIPSTTTDCDAMDSAVCVGQTSEVVECSCDLASTCACSNSSEVCDRVEADCLDSSRLQTTTGSCVDGRCVRSSRIVLCWGGCVMGRPDHCA